MSHLHPVNPETSCYIYAGNDRIHRRSQDDRFLHLLCAKQPTYTALVIRSYTDTFRYHSGYLFYRKDMGVFHDLRKVPIEIRATLLPSPFYIDPTIIVKCLYESPDHIGADSIPLPHVLSVYLLMFRMRWPYTFIK